MTTYYLYDQEKLVGTSTINPAPQHGGINSGNCSFVREGDIVGAYLARRARKYPAHGASEVCRPQNLPRQASGPRIDGDNDSSGTTKQDHRSSEDYDSQRYTPTLFPDHSSTVDYMGLSSRSAHVRTYPDPEHIRHLYSLHNMLPHIQPERKLNSLNGMLMDIVEQDTGVVLAYSVPKKLLVLFLGRQIVNKFVKTVKRQDNVNWQGPATSQILSLPGGQTSKAALKILVSWMIRGCQRHTMGSMQQIRMPKNTFVACSLAQTMELLGLHKDALWADQFIAHNHFVRPIFAVELEALWNCLGEKNRYVYAAIKIVGQRVQEAEHGSTKDRHVVEDIVKLLDTISQLKARVHDLELNEGYRPVFGTEWMYRSRDHPTSQRIERKAKHWWKSGDKRIREWQ